MRLFFLNIPRVLKNENKKIVRYLCLGCIFISTSDAASSFAIKARVARSVGKFCLFA
jgi:hypothetical protein